MPQCLQQYLRSFFCHDITHSMKNEIHEKLSRQTFLKKVI